MDEPLPSLPSVSEGPGSRARRFSCMQVLALLAVAMVVAAAFTGWWVNHYLYASPLTPTELTPKEQKMLNAKLAALDAAAGRETALGARGGVRQGRRPLSPDDRLVPEPYSEEGARREVAFTERELNAIIASDPEMARRVAADLADELISLKLVIPVEEDFPVLGGKTVRLNLGLQLAYRNNRPVVALKGISLGGVPLPNAWLGNLKNVNLVEEFGTEGGFWTLFADGVENLSVEEGNLRIRLKE